MRIPAPTVPVSTQSVGQFAAPTAAPMQDFTAQQLQQTGQSLLQAGASANHIGADLQRRANEGFLMEVDAIASELRRNTVGQYTQMAGLPAIEQFKDMHEGLRTQLRNLGDTARSPEQRQAVERLLAGQMQHASNLMVAHRDREITSRAIGGASAGIASAIEDYRASLGNPEDMEVARRMVVHLQGKLSQLKGEDGDMAKLAMLDTTTKLHLVAVDALLAAGRASEAGAYLESYKGEIEPQEAAKAGRVVKRAGIDDKAQRLTMLLDDGRDIQSKVNDADRMFAKGELTVEERDATVSRLRAADDDRYQQRNRTANKALADATDFARANRIQSIDQLPAQLRTQLEEVGELDKVQLFLDQGGQFVTTRLGLRAMNSVTPAQLLKVRSYDDLEAMFQGNLSTDDMAEMAARWRKTHAMAAEPGDEDKIERGLILRNAAREAGLLPSDRDPTDAEKARHDRFIEAAMREANSRFGGKATNEQFRTVARELAFDTLTMPSGGVKVPFSAATKEELQNGYFTVEGRQVFNKNVSEETKNQLLQAIDVYNAEAARRGMPQKPRTMAQVFTEWEKRNVVDRAELVKSKQAVQAEVFKDTDVLRAYHKVWRSQFDGGRDSQKTYETLNGWQSQQMRWMGENMTKAEWFMRTEGLTASQYAELLRVAQSDARTREAR